MSNLINSVCVNIYVACNCALISQRQDLLDWLISVWSHHYGKHHLDHEPGTRGLQCHHWADSDSAFCASDSSSVVESDDLKSLAHHSEKDPWQLYRDALLSEAQSDPSILQQHLFQVMTRLDAKGKRDMLAKLILPVLEHFLPLKNEMTLWSMKSFILLFPCYSIDAYGYKKKFNLISSVLMSHCVSGFDSDLGFTAFHCLKMMALSELTRRAVDPLPGSVEDTLPTSDEDVCNESDEVNIKYSASHINVPIF